MAKTPLFRRVLTKSPRTIFFRSRQEAGLKLMQLSHGWQALERRITRWAGSARAAAWPEQAPLAVLADDGASALKRAAEADLINADRLISGGDAIMARDFSIFEVPVPHSGPWPWHRDWRFDHEWPPAYFRSYRHAAPREQPYDVKFPWELSRLAFLPALVQADVLDGGTARTREAFRILGDWRAANPLAHSVNWYPMEAAMRGIQICLLADMARQSDLKESDAYLLRRMLAEHGEYVMRTLELTDNAGNHFTAELVALLLIGRTLHGFYPRARWWERMAAHMLGHELLRQFLPDGVNFEKSTAYHRLVLDLFLLAGIVLARSERPFDEVLQARLRAAAHYNAAFLRPDGLCPLIGDNDDAVVFGFEHRPVRDHRADLGVAALYCDDARLAAAAEALPAAGVWLFGEDALARWPAMPGNSASFNGCHHFAEGGVVVAKSANHYLFMDFGEVGQNGLGGHGHNDLLSFELFLNGQPIAVDPGTYLYSGDFAAHDRFRSTRAHNGLMVDGEEIAPFSGPFRIENRAQPVDATVRTSPNGAVHITAGHTGYRALPDPVTHIRELAFDLATGALRCTDRIHARGRHRVTRFVHLAPGLTPELGDNEARVSTGTGDVVVRWSPSGRARLEHDQVSPCFGQLRAAKTLAIDDDAQGDTTLMLEIRSEARRPLGNGGKAR